MSALVTITEVANAADSANWLGAVTYTRAPRGWGYPPSQPGTVRIPSATTRRPQSINTRR
jgi:hypothetical protein